ncbi:thiamine biosynthesis protein thio [Gammaproteobacteria bacterium SCGC AG-212-F23]|nr:thiamine biosynthesis protein thio [Gammaproteobacteria bacterium SCGC AG-212-F23]
MNAAIVGAGILGKLLAWSLQRAGWQITLIDAGKTQNCSQAAAGLLTPVAELEKNSSLIYQLGIKALQDHWPAILAELPENIYFQNKGSILLSHIRDQAEIQHFMDLVTHKTDVTVRYEALNQKTLTTLEPELTHFQKGYYFPDEGLLDNQTLLSVLEKILETRVTFLKNTEVTAIAPHQITFNNKIHTFDWVFDCRGLGAKSQFSDLRGIRGELIWVYAPDVHITRPIRFMHPRYRLYLAPRVDHIYLLGASEVEAEDYSAISVRSTLELLTALYCLHPKFAEARIIKTTTHCRPTLAHHLPKIKYTQGLMAINGLYRHGFLIAPTLIHDILRYFSVEKPPLHYPTLWEETCYDHSSIE